MPADSIERDFKEKVSAEISLLEEGIDRYRVFTPFEFGDGDTLAIVLKKHGANWMLTDEAHTYMHLSYQLDERDLTTGNREKLISKAIAQANIEDRDGELVLEVPDSRFGDALFSYIQALIKITDVTYLNRERVRSTFVDDVRTLILDIVSDSRATFDWHHPEKDPEAKYAVDCKINGMERPIFMFWIPTSERASIATIALLQFDKWNLQYRSIAIYEDQPEINRKAVARLTDACERQFASLAGNEGLIRSYLAALLKS